MGVIAAVHTDASYRISRFCSRDSHAGGHAMQAVTEAGCMESDKSVEERHGVLGQSRGCYSRHAG